jgi:hypothetical protein
VTLGCHDILSTLGRQKPTFMKKSSFEMGPYFSLHSEIR